MNGDQFSFLRACGGNRPQRTPVWMMRQAGRYLPEYRAVRQKVSFLELCRTPDLCAEVTMQPLDRYDLDAAILFSDILVVFDAMGVEVEFSPGPRLPNPVRTESDVARLRWGDPREEVGYVMDAVRACKRAVAGRAPLIGFCGAPFTIISYLLEGGASRDFEHTKRMLFSAPEVFDGLMSSMTSLLIQYLQGQVEAGADAIQIFDSWAGALTPQDYRARVLPHVDRLVREARAFGVPVIMFARGNAHHLKGIASTEADVIGVDWTLGLGSAIEVVGQDRVVQGNLDPMLLLGSPETLVARTREVVAAGKKSRAHIFNLGHGISRHTDPEMARLMIDTVHE